jgi:hypothetical protein
MPYIKKSDLEDLLRSAFGNGFWTALAVDHEEVSLHIHCDSEFMKYYEAYQQTKNDTTK